jgi:hypothetical protein
VAEGLINVTGYVFRRGIDALEGLQVVQEGVVQFLEKLGRSLFDTFEVDKEAVLSQLPAGDMHFDFPIVAVKLFAPALIVPKLVSGSHVCDDLEFVQSESSLTFTLRFCIGLAALAALAVNDDARAGAVRAEDAIFEIKGILLLLLFLMFLSEGSPAFHAVVTFLRHMGAAGRARFSDDFLMTVRAFHDGSQLFLDVFT